MDSDDVTFLSHVCSFARLSLKISSQMMACAHTWFVKLVSISQEKLTISKRVFRSNVISKDESRQVGDILSVPWHLPGKFDRGLIRRSLSSKLIFNLFWTEGFKLTQIQICHLWMNASNWFQAQSPTISLWKTSPPGNTDSSKSQILPFYCEFPVFRTLSAYQHRASGVTIMEQRTILPMHAEVLQDHHNKQKLNQSLKYHKNHKALMGRKTGWTATGCTGTAAWKIQDSEEMLVVMWSIPFDQNWSVHINI